MLVINKCTVPLLFKVKGNAIVIPQLEATEVTKDLMEHKAFMTLVDAEKVIISESVKKKDEELEKATTFNNSELTRLKKMEIIVSDNNDHDATIKQLRAKEEDYKEMIDTIKKSGKKADGRLSFTKIEEIYESLEDE